MPKALGKFTINLDVIGVDFPKKVVEVIDVEEALALIKSSGEMVFSDQDGEAYVKGKQIYAAALRRGTTLILRKNLAVGKKVYSVTLALPSALPKTNRGRPVIKKEQS